MVSFTYHNSLENLNQFIDKFTKTFYSVEFNRLVSITIDNKQKLRKTYERDVQFLLKLMLKKFLMNLSL